MPELPDVELYRRYFSETSLNKKIKEVIISDNSMLGKVSADKLISSLKDKKFSDTKRIGKYMFAKAGDNWLVLHYGMTGYLEYFKNADDKPSYTKLQIQFGNGYNLAYVCIRKLGVIDLTGNLEKFINSHKLGPDPLDNNFGYDDFNKIVSKGRGKIKSFFMNQKNIAGLGNMYVDELLFQTSLHPESDISRLDKKTIHQLYKNMNRILHKAIDKDAEIDKLPASYLISHRKKGAACPRCKGKIEVKKLSGRSTYFCNTHQERI